MFELEFADGNAIFPKFLLLLIKQQQSFESGSGKLVSITVCSFPRICFFLFHSRDYHKLSLCVIFSDTFDTVILYARAYAPSGVCSKITV